MRHTRRLSIVCFFSFFLFLPAVAFADTPAERVQQALDDLNSWLSDGPHEAGWRRYLKTDVLEAQLKSPDEAEKATIAEIHGLYAADVGGLELKRFADVRDALAEWLDELSQITKDDLPAAIQEAKSQFQAITPEQVAGRKAAVVDAAKHLEAFLARSGESVVNGWKSYLKWEDMEAQLDSEDGPDLKVLHSVGRQYYGNHEGFELPQFMAVREALLAYVNAAYYSSKEDLNEQYQENLDQLAEHLKKVGDPTAREDAIAVGKLAGWLESAGQAPHVVHAVRRYYSLPNVFVRSSKALMDAGMEQDVDQKNQFVDYLMGTRINANTHTRGRVTVELVPNDEHAMFDIRLKGQTNSQNVGYNGPVTIYSHGETKVNAAKRFVMNDKGLKAGPAVANCKTNSTVDNIAARSAMVRNIAWGRVNSSRDRAQRVASERAEERYKKRMDERAGKLVKDTNDRYVERFRKPLLRRDGFPQLLKFNSADDAMYVKAISAASSQIAAPGEAPEFEQQHDLNARIHESFVANFSQASLGGMQMTDENLANMLENMEMEVPEELQPGPDKDPWSITYEDEHPITAEFTDKGFTLTIHGRQFTRGEGRGTQKINAAMNISGEYHIEKTPVGVKLIRQGDVVAEYAKEGRQSVQQIAFKAFLRKKFESLFREEIVSDGLTLPGRMGERIGKMPLEEIKSGDGWLMLAWILPAKPEHTAKAE